MNQNTHINESLATDRRTIQDYLLRFDAKRVRYAEEKAQFMSQSHSTDGVKNNNHIPDPVACAALTSADYDNNNEEYWWLRAVELTENTLPQLSRCILLYRRKSLGNPSNHRGKPPWLAYVQAELCYNYPRKWYSESFIKRRWRYIVDKALLIKYKITP